MKNSLSTPAEDEIIVNDLKIHRAIKDYRLAQLGIPALNIIAERLGLLEFVTYFFEHNKTTAEYHNNYHSVCVALNCYEGAIHQKLPENETQTVVLAGIFHDFNHSGGVYSDEKNIARAIIGLWSAHIKIDDHYQHGVVNQAMQVLGITKYPFERSPSTIMEMIIRDADLMQPYEEDDKLLKKQYQGLHTEIERSYPIKFSIAEFAVGQLLWFKENVTWYSPWGKSKASIRYWKAAMQRLFKIMSEVPA